MSTDLSTLLNDVMPDVPGAGKELVLHAIRRAARDFCNYSRIHRVTLASFNTVGGTAGYVLTPPADTEIVDAVKVKYAGDKIDPLMIESLPDDSDAGTPTCYALDQDDTLILEPPPSAVAAVLVTVALMPTMTATAIDDTLAADWGDAIAKGAKARLMSMAKKTWSDSVQARNYKEDFEAEKASARLSGNRGKTRAPIRTVPTTIMGR
jgi:hypothetical protein